MVSYRRYLETRENIVNTVSSTFSKQRCFEKPHVSTEKPLGKSVCSIGYKERGKHVDGIMEMSEQHYGAKENRGNEEKESERFLVPIHERHKERKSRMPREEQVPGEGEIMDQLGIDRGMHGKRAQMRKAYEERSSNNKQPYGLYRKRSPFGICQAQCEYESTEKHCSIHENAADIQYGYVIKDDIRNSVVRRERRIPACVEIDWQAYCQNY